MKNRPLLLALICLSLCVTGRGNAQAQAQTREKAVIGKVKLSPDKIRKGRQIPMFTLPSRSGGTDSFGGTTGRDKNTLLVYGTSWCGYALLLPEQLVKIEKKYADKLNIVTVWADDTRDAWLGSGGKYKSHIAWTDLWEDRREVHKYLTIKIYPTLIILDTNDKVKLVMKGINFDKLLKALDKL